MRALIATVDTLIATPERTREPDETFLHVSLHHRSVGVILNPLCIQHNPWILG